MKSILEPIGEIRSKGLPTEMSSLYCDLPFLFEAGRLRTLLKRWNGVQELTRVGWQSLRSRSQLRLLLVRQRYLSGHHHLAAFVLRLTFGTLVQFYRLLICF